MSDNVGLSTPRGSGTSGFVQRNRAFLKPRDHVGAYGSASQNPRDYLDDQARKARLRQPDQGILEHDRKRAIEVRVFALRDELEEQEVDDDEIERRCDALRKQLTDAPANRSSAPGSADAAQPRRFKAHQVHEQAQAKIAESERLRRALRISKDYEEGSHWRRQEEKQALKRKQDEDDEGARARHAASDSDSESDGPREPPLRSVETAPDEDRDGRRVRQRRASSPRDSRCPSRSPRRSPSRSRSRGRSDSRSVSRSVSRSRSRSRGAK